MTRYLAGPVVTILAGADKELLSVHVETFLSCGSPSLRALVSADWKESRERLIDWSHVEAATVKRFLNFLYTGDYAVPDPESIQSGHLSDVQAPIKDDGNRPDDPLDAPAVPEADAVPEVDIAPELHVDVEPEEEWTQEMMTFTQNTICDPFGPHPLTPISKCLNAGLPSERIQTAAGRLEECSFASSTHIYGATLLAHARVYTFAQYHLVAKLQTFSLQRLTQALMFIDCTQAHAISDITPLIEYVYSNTLHDESREEPIRKLASQFAAIHYTDLMAGDFEEFFSRGGDFALDVARKISRRLAVSGGSTKLLEEEVDELEKQVRSLKLVAEDRDEQLRKLRRELAEWQNRERGVSKKGKKKTYW